MLKILLFASLALFAISRWRIALAGAIIVQSGYLVWRGLLLGRLPLLGPHDTLIFFSLSIGVMGLAVSRVPALRHLRWPSAATGILSSVVTLAALAFPVLDMPLPQILDTIWFELHVVLAFFAYALFVIGGMVCGAFLLAGGRVLLDLFLRTALIGWTFFSASMITGGIWGYYAWGTYWLWTPKELWTSVLWLYYAALLHLRFRYTGIGNDRLAAWLGVIGVGVTLFTYLGVSMLMKSSHSF